MPVITAKHPVIFKSVVLDLARVSTHIYHPRVGDPMPIAVWERIFLERDVRLVSTLKGNGAR